MRVVLGSGVVMLAVGCGTTPESTSVVCTDFRVGADLSGSTFGVTGSLERPYAAFAQAAGDLAAVANAMLRDVGASCKGMALELGAAPDDPKTVDKAEPEAVRAWCAIAAERFDAVRPKLAAAGFSVKVSPAKCTIDSTFQEACEEKCRTDAKCTESSALDRCPADARAGICNGTCVGTCTGTETEAEPVEGPCVGMCFGTCSEPMVAETCTATIEPPKCAGDVDCQNSCTASAAARAACGSGSLRVTVGEAAERDPATLRIVGAVERHMPAIFLAARGRADLLADGTSDLLDSAGHILGRSTEIGPMGAACGMLIGQTSSEARKNLNAALAGSNALAKAVTGEAGKAPPPSEPGDDE
jgi:hypothetical protein